MILLHELSENAKHKIIGILKYTINKGHTQIGDCRLIQVGR